MTSDTDLAWRLEEVLLQPEVRADAARLDTLLGPGFREIGGSGRLWSRAEVIDALTDETAEPHSPDITDRDAEELSGGLVLLTYRLRIGDHSTRRSSLWQLTGYGNRLVFHQGTPIRDD